MDTRIVDEALIALIGAESEDDVYAAVVAAVHGLLPKSFIVNTMLVSGTTTFRVSHTAGLDRYWDPIRKLVGFDPTAVTYDIDDMRPVDVQTYRSGELRVVDGGIHALTLGKLPRPACAAIESLLGVRNASVIGYAWGDIHYGALALALRGDDSTTCAETIETLVHQATIAIRRLRAEEELRAKQVELDTFFHQSLDLLSIADVHGYFRRVNTEWERTLGYRTDELEGRRFLDLVHPDDVAATLEALDRLAHGQPESRFINRYRTKDGRYRWLEWRAFPRGELIYAAARDLTEHIVTEQALRESETRYRFIAENTADVIWLMDVATGRFNYVSPAVERLRGLTPEEVMAQSVEASLTPESFADIARTLPVTLAAVRAGDESARVNTNEVDQPRADGSIVPTEVTTTCLTDEHGEVTEIIGVSRDITERRLAEAEIKALNSSLEARVAERTAQLEQAMAELEAFSYSVSHDLRSPLRAINGYATILGDEFGTALGADGETLCANIVRNTRRMGQLIDDLLGFARLGRTQLAKQPVDMQELALGVLDEARADGSPRHVSVDVGRLAPALGDPALLRQVWVNLVDNAFKFSTRRDTPRVEVGCLPDGGDNVYFVRDNGEGFDMRYVTKLFQVFERLQNDARSGSGIGLAIVRRIVEAHGGRVWAEGEPDGGATFFFAIPSAEPAEDWE
jgi:PAS domain S-box-containing protein